MRIPFSPPEIQAITDSKERPLWSLMIPVYNCSQYIPQVLESVLSQDLGEQHMQIEVVDDASTDADVEELVRRISKGRVKYFRQPENVGTLRNFETCINRSKGKLVHLLHGDDKVKPGFYQKMALLFHCYSQAGAAFSNYEFINDKGVKIMGWMTEGKEGILKDWFIRIAEMQRIQFVAMVVRREVYEKLGSFYGMTYGEDWEMWVRIAKHYPVAYTPEVLAEYRMHDGSVTWKNILAGRNIPELAKAMDIIQQHLPPKYRKKISERSKKYYARINVSIAKAIWTKTHNRALMQVQLNAALALSKHPSLYYHISRLYFQIIIIKLFKKKKKYRLSM
ncbi:MAG TPA: glycosyltransferase [Chitinophagaceae bacterium]|nr:glycosyltransferase [Chitinophagaceae bacterium]